MILGDLHKVFKMPLCLQIRCYDAERHICFAEITFRNDNCINIYIPQIECKSSFLSFLCFFLSECIDLSRKSN